MRWSNIATNAWEVAESRRLWYNDTMYVWSSAERPVMVRFLVSYLPVFHARNRTELIRSCSQRKQYKCWVRLIFFLRFTDADDWKNGTTMTYMHCCWERQDLNNSPVCVRKRVVKLLLISFQKHLSAICATTCEQSLTWGSEVPDLSNGPNALLRHLCPTLVVG